MRKRTQLLYCTAILMTLAACIAKEDLIPSAETNIDPLSGEALFADVERYASFGVHRTAGDGDTETAVWLAKELDKAGLDTQFQLWPLLQFTIDQCAVAIGDTTLECFPFWYPKKTPENGISAPLALMANDGSGQGLAGAIAVVSAAESGGRAIHSAGVNDLAKHAFDAGAVALLVVVPSAPREIIAVNAREPYTQQPLPLPAAIVAPKNEATLLEAAKRGSQATFTLTGEDDMDAQAQNVIADLKRGNKWVVVTTPTSGWFTCAGERGSGVALFLGLARWAAQNDSPYSYRFIGNAGHELDNLGAHRSMENFAPPVDDVACWLHLGASISAREWEETDNGFQPLDKVNTVGNLVSTQALLPAIQEAFAEIPWFTPRTGEPIRGELRHFIAAGYNAFGFFGGHHYFHAPKDSPETTEGKFLEPVAKALAEVLSAL